ncbi:transaldolase [Streptomyces sp. NPDC047130]|uniref:transaldolase n=1 Tax=Streptomyces sp. NPDC047130 TaxID=3155261 RepID=UPI0033CF2297
MQIKPDETWRIMSQALDDLTKHGVSIYLDDISRSRLESGDLRRLVERDSVVGVTTNPSIFRKALADGEGYDRTISDLARSEFSPTDALRILTCMDVRDAADVLAPIHRRTDGHDGWVSLEVNPYYANDTEATVAEATLLHWTVGRENVMIKVPATHAGIPAVTELVARGIPVNVTVIFSLTSYSQAVDAYMTGLERAHQQGLDTRKIRSVASFYLARIDDAIDRELDTVDAPAAGALRGKVALAHARLAHRAYDDLHNGERWRTLSAGIPGLAPQRLLWASTSTKDDRYSDTRYVTQLAVPGSINTMPESTLHAVSDHGVIPVSPLGSDPDSAQQIMRDLQALGISFDKAARQLETQAVTGFQHAWRGILDVLASRLAAR